MFKTGSTLNVSKMFTRFRDYILFFQGKSALWSHLLSFQEAEESQLDSSKPTDPNLLSPGVCSV